jgi:hypothetical protein
MPGKSNVSGDAPADVKPRYAAAVRSSVTHKALTRDCRENDEYGESATTKLIHDLPRGVADGSHRILSVVLLIVKVEQELLGLADEEGEINAFLSSEAFNLFSSHLKVGAAIHLRNATVVGGLKRELAGRKEM